MLLRRSYRMACHTFLISPSVIWSERLCKFQCQRTHKPKTEIKFSTPLNLNAIKRGKRARGVGGGVVQKGDLRVERTTKHQPTHIHTDFIPVVHSCASLLHFTIHVMNNHYTDTYICMYIALSLYFIKVTGVECVMCYKLYILVVTWL